MHLGPLVSTLCTPGWVGRALQPQTSVQCPSSSPNSHPPGASPCCVGLAASLPPGPLELETTHNGIPHCCIGARHLWGEVKLNTTALFLLARLPPCTPVPLPPPTRHGPRAGSLACFSNDNPDNNLASFSVSQAKDRHFLKKQDFHGTQLWAFTRDNPRIIWR